MSGRALEGHVPTKEEGLCMGRVLGKENSSLKDALSFIVMEENVDFVDKIKKTLRRDKRIN